MKDSVLDRYVVAELPAHVKIRELLAARGVLIKDFARKHNLFPPEVSMCLRGERPYRDIRRLLAEELGIPVAEMDFLLGGPAGTTEGAVQGGDDVTQN